MKKYICGICGYKYDESMEAAAFTDLPGDWLCPLCGAGKDVFVEALDRGKTAKSPVQTGNALFKASYGLYILSAKDNGKDNACVVNTFLQVTGSEPVMCVITVNKQNLTHDMIMNTERFNLSVLTTDTPFDVIKRFGYQSGRVTDKLEGYSGCSRSANGLIYLDKHTNAYMSFEVTGTIDFDSHMMFKAAFTNGEIISDNDNLTYDYYQKNIKPQPQPAQKSGYRCNICGYVYEGESLPRDFICPVCKHGTVDFIKIG